MIEEFIDRAEGLCVKSDTKEELYKYFNNKTPLVIESESKPINTGEKTTLGVNAFFAIFIMILNIIYERKHNHTWEILDLTGCVCAGIAIGMFLISTHI